VSGAWKSEDSFMIEYDEVGNINAYKLRLRFTDTGVEVTLSERSQVISSAKFRGVPQR
jgi:hypothetical protein